MTGPTRRADAHRTDCPLPEDGLFDPAPIERCRRCGRPVGDFHDDLCRWVDEEPEHPDEWTEIDPEAMALAEDRYARMMMGESS